MQTDNSHTDHAEKKLSYIPIVVVAVVLALLAWSLLHNFEGKGNMWAGNTNTTEGDDGHEAKMENTGASVVLNPTELGTLDTLTGNFVYNTGAAEELMLPDSTKLNVGANSTEAKLAAFLSDPKMMVDSADKTKGWISLDRLYFENGKSVLVPASQTQLKNIAAILKAFPNAQLKLGGYTDTAGTAEANIKLSDSRANAAMGALAAMGIATSRLAAEGYGQEHPVADNATAEGRALNRRIDVRVTKK